MSNREIWDRFADIDPKFTKAITGKAYRGTSPNPQYVVRCLTELFGPVGKGFGWEVLAEAFTPLGDEVLHWCRIRFWWSDSEGRHVTEQYGQTKALMKTKNGLMSDEDAPKKSLTDAIIKASSHLGIAANIFLGRWDDQKYVADVARSFADAPQPKRLPEPVTDTFETQDGIRVPRGAKLTPDMTKRQRAEEVARAIEAQFSEPKTAVGVNGVWGRNVDFIEMLRERHPDLHENVYDVFRARIGSFEEEPETA